jgi:hypothetical protein
MSNGILAALAGKILWVAFAFVFFYAGLFTTEWLLEPDAFSGGWRWLLVGLFPVLVPAFFVVNRRFGCASGACLGRRCSAATRGESMRQMPGA